MVLRDPEIFVVPGTVGLVCLKATGSGANPRPTTPIAFRFPRALFVEGVLVLPRRNVAWASLENQMASLALSITDETTHPIMSDGRATTKGTFRAPVAAPLLGLHGRGFHPFKLQRPVAASDAWVFSVQNADSVDDQTLAGIFLYFSDPEAPR